MPLRAAIHALRVSRLARVPTCALHASGSLTVAHSRRTRWSSTVAPTSTSTATSAAPSPQMNRVVTHPPPSTHPRRGYHVPTGYLPTKALDHILRPIPNFPRVTDLQAWLGGRDEEYDFSKYTIEQAIYGGFQTDRAAYAFASGYQAALRSSDAFELGSRDIGALCATEKGGNRPKDILSTITFDKERGTWHLNGEKTFVTLGTHASVLWVTAKDPSTKIMVKGQEQDMVRVVQVDPTSPGVKVKTVTKDLPFVSEVPHAVAKFNDVYIAPADISTDDGYLTVLKPFRTIEDIHVRAALVSYAVRLGRELGVPNRHISALLTCLVELIGLLSIGTESPVTHVSLGDSAVLDCVLNDMHLSAKKILSGEIESTHDPLKLDELGHEVHRFFEVDRAVFNVAATARDLRTASAWEMLSRVEDIEDA